MVVTCPTWVRIQVSDSYFLKIKIFGCESEIGHGCGDSEYKLKISENYMSLIHTKK